MTELAIPLTPRPSQVLNIQLAQLPCKIAVYQKRTGLYLDLRVDDAPIILGVLCRDRVWLVRGSAVFIGDLTFIDTRGLDDPDYTGLGDRFQLIWTG